MPDRSVAHETLVVERRYGVVPSRVFAAWVEPDGRSRWDVPGDGWDHVTDERDVRVGGRDVIRFGPSGSLIYRAITTYVDIVTDQRLVSTYTVTHDDVVMAVSLLTVEVRPDGDGTAMTVTEQAVFLDDMDSPVRRLSGLNKMFDNLAVHLDGQ